MLLESIHPEREPGRLSFAEPTECDAHVFAMSVDEPLGGPVIVRVCGDIDPSSTQDFAAGVSDAVVAGRSMVVDLLDVDTMARAGTSILEAAAIRLRHHNSELFVACTASLHSDITGNSVDEQLECFDTLAQAVAAAAQFRNSREP